MSLVLSVIKLELLLILLVLVVINVFKLLSCVWALDDNELIKDNVALLTSPLPILELFKLEDKVKSPTILNHY